MKIQKQTVYVPVKVEDELPEIGESVFTSDEEIDTCSFLAKDGKFKEWYQHFEHEPTHWLKPHEGYFFTSVHFNQLLSDVIKDTLNTAAENAYIDNNHQQGGCMDADDFEINKESIINQHKNILKKWKI